MTTDAHGCTWLVRHSDDLILYVGRKSPLGSNTDRIAYWLQSGTKNVKVKQM
jgi:hypothetical protein